MRILFVYNDLRTPEGCVYNDDGALAQRNV